MTPDRLTPEEALADMMRKARLIDDDEAMPTGKRVREWAEALADALRDNAALQRRAEALIEALGYRGYALDGFCKWVCQACKAELITMDDEGPDAMGHKDGCPVAVLAADDASSLRREPKEGDVSKDRLTPETWKAVHMGSEGWAVFRPNPKTKMHLDVMITSGLTQADAELIASAPALQLHWPTDVSLRDFLSQWLWWHLSGCHVCGKKTDDALTGHTDKCIVPELVALARSARRECEAQMAGEQASDRRPGVPVGLTPESALADMRAKAQLMFDDEICGPTFGRVREWADALDALQRRVETAERNHVERKHIDATPNDGYPLRILRAYRADCDMRWSLSTTNGGQDATPLMEELNTTQDQRAAILDRAIAALPRSPEEETP